MKQNWIEAIQALLISQMNHWVIISLPLTVLGLFGREEPHLMLWFSFGLLTAFLYFVRDKVHNFFLFFGIHLLILAAVIGALLFFFGGDLLLQIVGGVLTVIYMIASIVIRIKKGESSEERILPAVAIGVIGAVTLLENLHSKMGWEKYYLLLAILYLGAYFISYFLGNYLRFLVVNESSVAVMPEKEILSSGMKQTALFTAGGLCILLLTANIQWAAYLFSLVGKVLLAILKWLVSLLSKEETEEVEELVMTSNQGMSDMGGLGEAGDPALIWVILEKILMFLVTVGVAVVFVVVIVMICRYIWKQFHNVKVVEQEKLQKGRDVREVCGIERNTRESAVIWSPFLNNRERVRKVYRKQILKNKFHIIGNHNVEDLKCMTAKECCDKISEESGSANCLKKIYEKARYSSYEVTSEDVKNMKAAVK